MAVHAPGKHAPIPLRPRLPVCTSTLLGRAALVGRGVVVAFPRDPIFERYQGSNRQSFPNVGSGVEPLARPPVLRNYVGTLHSVGRSLRCLGRRVTHLHVRVRGGEVGDFFSAWGLCGGNSTMWNFLSEGS